jgi:dynein heavy chain
MSQFLADQTTRANYVSDIALKEWEERVREIVERAGHRCLTESGFPPKLDSSEQQQSGSKKLSYTDQAARRSECRKLQRFVKLADYMIVHTLHMLLIESLRDFLGSVYRGCSNSDVTFDNSGLGLTVPTEFLQAFKGSQNQLDVLSKGNENRIQVGGVVVGPEVGTNDLISCGFEGFIQILSKIVRSSLNPSKMSDESENDSDGVAYTKAEKFIRPEKSIRHEKSTFMKEGECLKGKTEFRPLFRTELLMQTTERKNFYLLPSLPDFLNTVDLLLKAYLKILEAFPLLTNTFPFLNPANLSGGSYSSIRGLEDSELNEGPQLSAICMETGYFRELCGRLRGVFFGMFTNASNWLSNWENIREMWIENEFFDVIESLRIEAGEIAVLLARLDPNQVEGGMTSILQAHKQTLDNEALLKDPKFTPKIEGILEIGSTIIPGEDGAYTSPLVNFFENCLKKFSSQKQAMEAIPTTSIINNILVDADKLKALLLPSPERCFNDVARVLPKVAREKNELLLNEMQTWVRLLGSQPANVEAFVDYLGWLDKGIDCIL